MGSDTPVRAHQCVVRSYDHHRCFIIALARDRGTAGNSGLSYQLECLRGFQASWHLKFNAAVGLRSCALKFKFKLKLIRNVALNTPGVAMFDLRHESPAPESIARMTNDRFSLCS